MVKVKRKLGRPRSLPKNPESPLSDLEAALERKHEDGWRERGECNPAYLAEMKANHLKRLRG